MDKEIEPTQKDIDREKFIENLYNEDVGFFLYVDIYIKNPEQVLMDFLDNIIKENPRLVREDVAIQLFDEDSCMLFKKQILVRFEWRKTMKQKDQAIIEYDLKHGQRNNSN